MGGTEVESKNEAPLSGRVPHVRPGAYTRISCRVSCVDELHAAFLNESRTRIRRWRPVQEIRDHGPKTDFQMLSLHGTRILVLGRSPLPR